MRRGVLLVGGPCDGKSIWVESGQFEYVVAQTDYVRIEREAMFARDVDPIPVTYISYRPRAGGDPFRWYAHE